MPFPRAYTVEYVDKNYLGTSDKVYTYSAQPVYRLGLKLQSKVLAFQVLWFTGLASGLLKLVAFLKNLGH